MNTFLEAMLNGWWQGIVLTLLVWLALRDLPRVSAATRLVIWQVTLLVVLLLPALQRIPLASWQHEVEHPLPPVAVSRAETSLPADSTPEPAAPPRPVIELPETNWRGFLLAASSALAFIQLLRLAIGYLVVRRLKRKALPAGIAMPVTLSRSVQVLTSDRIGMPMAVGFRHPAILLPRALMERLTPEEVRHILLHESAHMLRNDDWMALAERVIRAIFFFQPAVHWIGRQIEREREFACDDWVVAQSGDAKPYATSLARLAELGSPRRVPILATGAGRPKEIFARLETLLDRTRNRIPAVSETMVILAAIVLLVAVSQGAHFNYLFGLSNYSSRWVESDGSHRRGLKMRGEVRFTPNDQDVESMSPGAALVVEQSDASHARTVEYEADDRGNIRRLYFLDGVVRPFDADAQRLLAKILAPWVREQGFDVPERLFRMIEEKGIDPALEDIRTIRSTGVKRRYLEELFTQASLNPSQISRALKIAAEMGSDGDKRRFFETVRDRCAGRGLESQILGFIDTIHSDDDRRHLLNQAIEQEAFGESSLPRMLRSVSRISSDNAKADLLRQTALTSKKRLPQAFFDAASTIRSDGDRERLLSMVLTAQGDDPETVGRVLQITASMSSDSDKAKILVASAHGFRGGQETLRDVSRVLASIHSDSERRRGLDALIEANGKDTETIHEVLVQALAMNSDADRTHVLLQVAGSFPEQEPVRHAFFAAVHTMHSSADQRRVLLAVLGRTKLEAETLHEVSRSALWINANEDRAAILRALSERQ